MNKQLKIKKEGKKEDKKNNFDPFHLISNNDFCTNMNAIIAYYQMTKRETRKRFIVP